MRLDISSRSLEADTNGKENLQACQAECKKYGFDFGVQLHNTVGEDILSFVKKQDVLISAHAPICGDYSLNLATSSNLDLIFQAFEANYRLLMDMEVDLSVFHGFAMSDKLIGSMKTQADYEKNLSLLKRDDLRVEQNKPINNDFRKLAEYQDRLQILKDNLVKVRELYPKVTFCIENDLPVYGYGGMTLSDLTSLNHPVCIDMGHLWCSALALDFDFYQELEIGLASGLTKMIHFHNSRMTKDMAKGDLGDGHLNLNQNYELDLLKSFKLLEKYNIDYIVLEISRCNPQDIAKIAEFMKR